jgi:ribose transport system permease protein
VAVVQNGLNLHAVQLAWQDVTLGLVIILAVGVDMWRGNLAEAFSRLFRRSAEDSGDRRYPRSFPATDEKNGHGDP